MDRQLVCGRFRIRGKLGSGSFGDIYRAEDTKTKRLVAVKIEKVRCEQPRLHEESRVYQRMVNCVNTPEHLYFGGDATSKVMVIELGGRSLEALLQNGKGPMSLKTLLMLADQMLSALEMLHRMGFIHRDIKPDNFVLGLGHRQNQVLLIDYGLSRTVRDLATGEHIRFSERNPLVGTARYASANALRGIEQSRRDDLEGLAYVLVYLLKGTLPWMNLGEFPTVQAKCDRIGVMKTQTTPETLCRDLPAEFTEFLTAVKKLKFQEQPDYAGYRRLFRGLFLKSGFVYDAKYDWTTGPEPHKGKLVLGLAQPLRKSYVKLVPARPLVAATTAKEELPDGRVNSSLGGVKARKIASRRRL